MAKIVNEDLYYTVQDLPNGSYWTFDREDMDLEYVEDAITAWTAWRDFIIREGLNYSE